MAQCRKCGRTVTSDEIGLNKKLIDRTTSSYFCLTCMADYFKCDETLLQEKIRQFRSLGCMLFAPDPDSAS